MLNNPTPNRRSVLGTAFAGALAGIAGCITPEGDTASTETYDQWPTAKDGQQRVMLVATSHLAQVNSGDSDNTFVLDAGDILGVQRQSELETLTDRLAAWEPDRIAVEHLASDQSTLEAAYTAYSDDTIEIDNVDGWDVDRRDEIVQVGFRLADKLDHESVAGVDYKQGLMALMTDEEKKQVPTPPFTDPDTVGYPLPDFREKLEAEQQRLRNGSLLDHYKRMNTLDPGSFAQMQDEQLYATAFENSEPENYTLLKMMSSWFQRNLKIASNIWNVPNADDERVLVVYGASHIPGLLRILTDTPMMAPVSPLPYVENRI